MGDRLNQLVASVVGDARRWPLEQRLFRRCPILYRERLMSKAPEGDVHSLPIIFKPFVGRGKTCAISIASCFSSPGI